MHVYSATYLFPPLTSAISYCQLEAATRPQTRTDPRLPQNGSLNWRFNQLKHFKTNKIRIFSTFLGKDTKANECNLLFHRISVRLPASISTSVSGKAFIFFTLRVFFIIKTRLSTLLCKICNG